MATLIKNGKIYTMAGPVIEGGSILIENGKITAVGQDVVAPVNAEIIDARHGRKRHRLGGLRR